jgi:hypothetical protein
MNDEPKSVTGGGKLPRESRQVESRKANAAAVARFRERRASRKLLTGEGNAPRDVRDIESSPYCDPCETGADEREAVTLSGHGNGSNAPRVAKFVVTAIGQKDEIFDSMEHAEKYVVFLAGYKNIAAQIFVK